jgi:hypothetical protein
LGVHDFFYVQTSPAGRRKAHTANWKEIILHSQVIAEESGRSLGHRPVFKWGNFQVECWLLTNNWESSLYGFPCILWGGLWAGSKVQKVTSASSLAPPHCPLAVLLIEIPQHILITQPRLFLQLSQAGVAKPASNCHLLLFFLSSSLFICPTSHLHISYDLTGL